MGKKFTYIVPNYLPKVEGHEFKGKIVDLNDAEEIKGLLMIAQSMISVLTSWNECKIIQKPEIIELEGETGFCKFRLEKIDR